MDKTVFGFQQVPTGTPLARALAERAVQLMHVMSAAGLPFDLDVLCFLVFAAASESRTPMKRVCAALMEYELRNPNGMEPRS